jgi:hypothetical protein
MWALSPAWFHVAHRASERLVPRSRVRAEALIVPASPRHALASGSGLKFGSSSARLAKTWAYTQAGSPCCRLRRSEAATVGIPVADPSAAFKANGQAFMTDRVHPNEAGHAAIAQAFCNATTVACVAPPPPPPPPTDTDPPETSITKGAPNKLDKSKVKFKFVSNEPGSTFECKKDKTPFKPCSSPTKMKGLDEGRHRFKVRAIDAAGNVDSSPAKDKFKVVD